MKPPKDLFVQREPYAANMFVGWEQPTSPENIHYREVVPGTVTLNRDEIDDVVHYLRLCKAHLPDDGKYIDRIIKHLSQDDKALGDK